MNSSADILDFLVSKVFKLYAMHETIRKRILDIAIPNYRLVTQDINDEKNKDLKLKDVKVKGKDYGLLKAYLEMLVTHNIKPIIVAMPVKERYQLDEEFFSTVRKSGGVVLDYRELQGLDNSMFRDPIHLNERGNRVFTNRLAADFKNIEIRI